jgi:hypothetical protein
MDTDTAGFTWPPDTDPIKYITRARVPPMMSGFPFDAKIDRIKRNAPRYSAK